MQIYKGRLKKNQKFLQKTLTILIYLKAS